MFYSAQCSVLKGNTQWCFMGDYGWWHCFWRLPKTLYVSSISWGPIIYLLMKLSKLFLKKLEFSSFCAYGFLRVSTIYVKQWGKVIYTVLKMRLLLTQLYTWIILTELLYNKIHVKLHSSWTDSHNTPKMIIFNGSLLLWIKIIQIYVPFYLYLTIIILLSPL